MSKNILYISQYYPPEIGAGSVRSESIVNKFADSGWNVDVICEIPNYPLGNRYPGFEKGKYFKEKLANGITVHRIFVLITQRRRVSEQLSQFISFMITSFFYVLKLRKKYDVIYCSSPPLFAGLSAILLSKLKKTKFVFEVRDIWPDSAKDSFSSDKSIIYRIGLWLEKIIYKNADLVIAVTNEAAKLIKQKVTDIEVEVIHNGVDTNLFYPIPKEKIEIDENLDSSKFIVGYVGSLGVIHDLETFIKAAKICEQDPNIEFVIVGDGGRNNLLNEIIDSVKPNNVKWVGLKPFEKIPHYISSFDIAINPMKKKKIFDSVITVKFYEYLACGVPVITSDLKSMAKLASKSKSSITFKTGSEIDLSDKILHLKNNKSELDALKAESTNFIKSHFDRSELADKLIQMVSIILN